MIIRESFSGTIHDIIIVEKDGVCRLFVDGELHTVSEDALEIAETIKDIIENSKWR